MLCSCVSKGVLHEPQMFQICALVVWCELTMCTFPVFIVKSDETKGLLIIYYFLYVDGTPPALPSHGDALR